MSEDSLLTLCRVTAAKCNIDRNELTAKIIPVLSNPIWREWIALFLTNLKDSRLSRNIIDGENKRALEMEVDRVQDEITSGTAAFRDASLEYQDIYDRLSRSQSFSMRRQLLDAVDDSLVAVSSCETADPVQGLKEIAGQTSQKARQFKNLRTGDVFVDENKDTKYKEFTAETRKCHFSEYCSKMKVIHQNLVLERNTTKEIHDLIESYFSSTKSVDTSFIIENIASQMDYARDSAEVAVLSDRISSLEV